MKLFLVLLLASCATAPPEHPVEQVCYTTAENGALAKSLIDQNEKIDELNAKIRQQRRDDYRNSTRFEGLKGYCL